MPADDLSDVFAEIERAVAELPALLESLQPSPDFAAWLVSGEVDPFWTTIADLCGVGDAPDDVEAD